MFPQYLYPINSWHKFDTPLLRTAVLIGYMQSGKTVLARHLATRAYRTVVKSGYDDDEFRYLETTSLKKARKIIEKAGLEKTKFFFIFVDDAIKSAHARERNVEETTYFVDIRHWTIKRGILTVVYATQNFKLLDSIMRYAHVYIWKTLPFEYAIEKEARQWTIRYIGDPDFVNALASITREVYGMDPDKALKALKKAVVRIPLMGYGPKLYVDIPKEQPPQKVWLRLEEGEGEEGNTTNNNTIDIVEAQTLARALVLAIRETGMQIKHKKKKYLVLKWKDGTEKSLGPVIPVLQKIGVEPPRKRT